jgi:hypothetical protein
LPTGNAAATWTLNPRADQTTSYEVGTYNGISDDIHAIQTWIEREVDLSTIGKFQHNWDGFDASAPDPVVLDNAITFLRTLREYEPASPPTRAVLSPDGLIAFEWLEGNSFVRAEVEDSNEVEWMFAISGQPTHFSVSRLKAPIAERIAEPNPASSDISWEPLGPQPFVDWVSNATTAATTYLKFYGTSRTRCDSLG